MTRWINDPGTPTNTRLFNDALNRIPIPPRARVYRTAPGHWTFDIPNYAWGWRTTQPAAYAAAHLLATLAGRSPWPRNHPLPRRTPGQALAQLDAAWPKYQPAWPDDERRTPPDTCTDCLDIGHTEP